MLRKFTIIIIMSLALIGCRNTDVKEETKTTETQVIDTSINIEESTNSSKEEQSMIVEINGEKFKAQLYDNDTTNSFKQMLPSTFLMDEHNGNEKFVYMDKSLPSESKKIGRVKSGDIMLFGSDCLVVFYKSFQTSYTYTRIGHISDTKGLVSALGRGSVEVRFYLNES